MKSAAALPDSSRPSSPGCANFGLKKAADDGREDFGSAAADFIYDDFYVDDGLTSLPTVHEALGLLVKTQQICAKHGFRLHKFASNSKTADVDTC